MPSFRGTYRGIGTQSALDPTKRFLAVEPGKRQDEAEEQPHGRAARSDPALGAGAIDVARGRQRHAEPLDVAQQQRERGPQPPCADVEVLGVHPHQVVERVVRIGGRRRGMVVIVGTGVSLGCRWPARRSSSSVAGLALPSSAMSPLSWLTDGGMVPVPTATACGRTRPPCSRGTPASCAPRGGPAR